MSTAPAKKLEGLVIEVDCNTETAKGAITRVGRRKQTRLRRRAQRARARANDRDLRRAKKEDDGRGVPRARALRN